MSIVPPLKTFAAAVFVAVLGAFQAGQEVALDLPGQAGDVVSIVVAALTSAGAFTFARRWWERRQDRLERDEDVLQDELRRLRYDLYQMGAYAGRAYQAATSAGVEIEPPPAVSIPPPLFRPPGHRDG